MSTQVVKVRREKIAACMTCPLCNKLLKEATTISLCLHTFCRKCIYDKLSDEEVDTCPVCDINLGCVPVDKLRPDHNLQDIRAKIFPLKGRKAEAPEAVPPASPPIKRKERSLSSLVVSTPRVSVQAGVTGRRTRAGVRKGSASRGASPATEGTPKKEDDSGDDHLDGSSSPETLNKIIQNKKQTSNKSPSDQIRGENMENTNEGWDGQVELWKPLNTLVEAANRSKFSKGALQGPSNVKQDPSSSGDAADGCTTKIKAEENGQRTESQDDKSRMPSVPVPEKRKRLRNKNRPSASADSSSSQVMLNAARRNWKNGPIWFSLVPAENVEEAERLPQVSATFLRVKDGNMPVSYIQKYIVQKLNLPEETEIELLCQGQPVLPHLKLNSLLDLWLRSSSNPKKVRTTVGDSAREFVMVLSYFQKVTAPAS